MAPENSQTGPIVVYGATGYTGKLVAAELARLELRFTLAGRDRPKLERLAEQLDGDVPFEAAAVDDPAALRALLADAACVISCAGPFSLIGEPVVAAAVETGTHYVDTTGEQGFVKRVQDRYDAEARNARVAVIPAMGYDSVPADMGAHLAAAGIEPLQELVVAYSIENLRATRGTMLTALEVMGGNGLAYRDGAWRAAPAVPIRRRVVFPAPLGEQSCMGFPAAEVATVPRHVRTRNMNVLLAAESLAPHRWLAPALPFLTPALSAALRTPLRQGMARLIRRLPAGPQEGKRRALTFTLLIDARGSQGHRRVVVRGRDMYGLTAAICAHGAKLAVTPGFERAGVLAPAQAFDSEEFLAQLDSAGLSVERQ